MWHALCVAGIVCVCGGGGVRGLSNQETRSSVRRVGKKMVLEAKLAFGLLDAMLLSGTSVQGLHTPLVVASSIAPTN